MSFPILCNTDYVVVFIFSLKYISHPVPSPDLSFQPDEHLEVYVSTSENPHHFWIQILGLDKLTAEMSRFYSKGTRQVSHTLLVFYRHQTDKCFPLCALMNMTF